MRKIYPAKNIEGILPEDLTEKRSGLIVLIMSKYRSKTAKAAAAFGALSNPHRLQAFLRLLDCCPPGTACSIGSGEAAMYVGELGKGLGIAPSTLSHHIKELRAAGLISLTRRGKNIECRVEPERVAELAALFAPATGVGINKADKELTRWKKK